MVETYLSKGRANSVRLPLGAGQENAMVPGPTSSHAKAQKTRRLGGGASSDLRPYLSAALHLLWQCHCAASPTLPGTARHCAASPSVASGRAGVRSTRSVWDQSLNFQSKSQSLETLDSEYAKGNFLGFETSSSCVSERRKL